MTLLPCGTIFQIAEHLTEPKHILAAWLYNSFDCEVLYCHEKLISNLKVWGKKDASQFRSASEAVTSMFGALLRSRRQAEILQANRHL